MVDEREEVVRWPRSESEDIRVSLAVSNGFEVLEVAVFGIGLVDGAARPTGEGIRVRVEHLDRLETALRAVRLRLGRDDAVGASRTGGEEREPVTG